MWWCTSATVHFAWTRLQTSVPQQKLKLWLITYHKFCNISCICNSSRTPSSPFPPVISLQTGNLVNSVIVAAGVLLRYFPGVSLRWTEFAPFSSLSSNSHWVSWCAGNRQFAILQHYIFPVQCNFPKTVARAENNYLLKILLEKRNIICTIKVQFYDNYTIYTIMAAGLSEKSWPRWRNREMSLITAAVWLWAWNPDLEV